MDSLAPKKVNWSVDEIETLVDNCSGKSLGEMNSKFWEEVTEKVNSVGTAMRPVFRVKKKWSDMKSSIKKKGIQINNERQKTGGGVMVPTLSRLQEKVLAGIPSCAVQGIVTGSDTFLENMGGFLSDTDESLSMEPVQGTSSMLSLSSNGIETKKSSRIDNSSKRKFTENNLEDLLKVEREKTGVLKDLLIVQRGMLAVQQELLELKKLKYTTESFYSS